MLVYTTNTKGVELLENNDKGQIIIYQSEDGQTNIDVLLEDETVWLTQQQMSELFQTSRTNVVEHIKHIYEEGELEEDSTCRNFRQVGEEGNRTVSRMRHRIHQRIIRLGQIYISIKCT